jgi:murein DD-endopeptidase MepM/ murein hydrolase activator NlpD
VGIDITAREGAHIVAPGDGMIVEAGWANAGAGYVVQIRHDIEGRLLYSRHLHCTPQFPVTPGQHVNQGDLVGYVGNTGSSISPHDHSELIWDYPGWQHYTTGLHIDPEPIYYGTSPNLKDRVEQKPMIEDIQRALNNNGYTDAHGNPLVVDGVWGDKTAFAFERMVEATGQGSVFGQIVQLTRP